MYGLQAQCTCLKFVEADSIKKKHYPVTALIDSKCLSSPANTILPLHIQLLKDTHSLCSVQASSLELEARVKVK